VTDKHDNIPGSVNGKKITGFTLRCFVHIEICFMYSFLFPTYVLNVFTIYLGVSILSFALCTAYFPTDSGFPFVALVTLADFGYYIQALWFSCVKEKNNDPQKTTQKTKD